MIRCGGYPPWEAAFIAMEDTRSDHHACTVFRISILINRDDLHRAQVRRFPGTGGQLIRHLTLRAAAAEPVHFNKLRMLVTWVLVKDLRAGVPARATADTGIPLNFHVHANMGSLVLQLFKKGGVAAKWLLHLRGFSKWTTSAWWTDSLAQNNSCSRNSVRSHQYGFSLHRPR